MSAIVIPFDHLRITDIDRVGGKNASLGEMIGELSAKGVRVPGGFATTAQAFRDFLSATGGSQLGDVIDVEALESPRDPLIEPGRG